MILLEEISPVGKFAKTHGVKGEVNIDFDTDFDIDACEFLIVDMDGIFVPFFIGDYRFKNNVTALVKLDGINTEERAREFFGKTAYVKKEFLTTEENENQANYYVGYILEDENGKTFGQISEVDYTTENVMFVLQDDTLIPVAAIEVINHNEEKRILTVKLPDGLLDIDNMEEI